MEYYSLEEIFDGKRKSALQHKLLGSVCIVRHNQNRLRYNIGYLSLDPDINSITISDAREFHSIRFPKGEYHYTVHRAAFREIQNTYSSIEELLELEELSATTYPILVFPRGIPASMDQETIIEIWTGTDADFEAEERRSEKIKEALPRKSFNFYTW